MRSDKKWGTYGILGLVQWACGIAIAFGSAATKTDAAKYVHVPYISSVVPFLQNWAWLFVPVLMLVVAGAQLVRTHIGAPSIWGHVHFLVDEFRKQLFADVAGATHHHRVTLYKRTKRLTIWE